jgi:hypothetical protein
MSLRDLPLLLQGAYGTRSVLSLKQFSVTVEFRVSGWQWVMQRNCRCYSVLLPGVLLLDANNGLRRLADAASCHIRAACICWEAVAEVCVLLLMDLDGARCFRNSSRRDGLRSYG